MSAETPVQTTPATPAPNATLVSGLSMIGGLGITLVIVGFLIGAFDPTVSSGVVGLLIFAGLLILVGAIVAWTGLVRPFDHFDDINVPQYHGHAHDHHDDHAPDAETEGEVNATAAIPADHADKAAHADNVRVYPAPNTAH